MTANPRRSPKAAAQNLTDELNQTLRNTITESRLVCRITAEWVHIGFTDDRPVRLDDRHWLYIGLDLYLGELDEERGQYRNHILNSIFAYLDSEDRRAGAVLEYHLHRMDLRGTGSVLAPHLHARRADVRRQHIFVGRCCIEDLIEYLIREEGVRIPRAHHPDGKPLTEEELYGRAGQRLLESRNHFHNRFKTWHGMTPIEELPNHARRLLEQLG